MEVSREAELLNRIFQMFQSFHQCLNQQSIAPLMHATNMILENQQQQAEKWKQLEHKIQRMESHIEKLTKEIADLQIHALHGVLRQEPPYEHF
jgi:TolA-binding protein